MEYWLSEVSLFLQLEMILKSGSMHSSISAVSKGLLLLERVAKLTMKESSSSLRLCLEFEESYTKEEWSPIYVPELRVRPSQGL